MTDFSRFEKHIETLNKTIYREPAMGYHEKIVDAAFDNFIKKGSFTNALDVGFGTAYTLNKFKDAGIKATGITLEEKELQGARFIGHDVRLMDMNFLEFPDGSFDLVWCRHTLEHSIMPLIALMEFLRVLKPCGHLYVEVPSDNVIHIDNPNHHSLFSDAVWQGLFRKVGFRLLFRGQFAVGIMGSPQTSSYTDLYWQYWMKKEAE